MKHNTLKRTLAAGLAVLCAAAYAPTFGNTGLFDISVTVSASSLTITEGSKMKCSQTQESDVDITVEDGGEFTIVDNATLTLTGSFTAESNSIIILGAASKIIANSIDFSSTNVTVPDGYAVKITDTCIKTIPQWQSGDCTVTLDTDDGTLTVSGTGAMDDYDYNEYGEVVPSPWYNYSDKITSVEIQNGITSIGNYAFYRCEELTSITIPNSVTSIGTDVFSDCTSLKSVTIPDGVKSIGEYAFFDCERLTSITIPVSVTSIGENAFYLCQNITDVYCYANPAKLTWNDGECDDFIKKPQHTTVCYVPERYLADYNTKFGAGSDDPVNVTFKAKATDKCGDHATWLFDPDTHKLTISGTGEMYDYDDDPKPWNDYSDNITSVEIKNGVTSIGNSAFAYCKGLTSITIPDSVESIGADAFSSCESLTSITIPDSVESIGADAFYNCTSLTSITIPDSVESIDYDAFYGCTGITDVYCYANPANLTWNEGIFYDFKADKETICHVPERNLADYNTKFGAGSDHPVNVTFAGDLSTVDMGLGEHLYGYSVSVEGDIGVNFFVELNNALLTSDTAKMVFTVPNGKKSETQTLPVKDVVAVASNKVVSGDKTYYKFKCSVAAKDMASPITAQMFNGDSAGIKYRYSVKDYADQLLASPQKYFPEGKSEKGAAFVRAMLRYGSYAQKYFNEGTAFETSGSVEDVTIPVEFKYNADNTSITADGVTFEGATLSLKSETTLSLYFTGLPEGTEFTCGSKTVQSVKNGKYIVARIRGIKAEELKNNFTLTFTGGSVTYNAMTYCYNVQNGGSSNAKLLDVCKALYQYAEAANAYFSEGERTDEDPDW